MPKQVGPFTAVVLVGATPLVDHDETTSGHKPFLILADYLSEHGIAVLRLDGRGNGKTTGLYGTATPLDYSYDIEAGITYLKSRKDIIKTKIGLLGHGTGGAIASIIAMRSKDVAFIVMLSSPGVTGARNAPLQIEATLRASGESEALVSACRRMDERLYKIITAEDDPDKAAPKLDTAFLDELKNAPPDTQKMLARITLPVTRLIRSQWDFFFAKYDPALVLQKVKCPVLAITGSRNLQYPISANVPAMSAAFKTGSNADFQQKTLEGLNYMLQECKTGLPSEYVNIEQTLSPTVLNEIGSWVGARR